MKESQQQIQGIKEHLLFIHAFTGCDTTSTIFDEGKSRIINVLKSSSRLQDASKVLTSPTSEQSEVGSASIEAFKVIYGGSRKDSLTYLRYVCDFKIE